MRRRKLAITLAFTTVNAKAPNLQNQCPDNFPFDPLLTQPCMGKEDATTITEEECSSVLLCCWYVNEEADHRGCYYNENTQTPQMSARLTSDLEDLNINLFDTETILEANAQMEIIAKESYNSNSESDVNSFKRMGSFSFDPRLNSANNWQQANQFNQYSSDVNNHLKRFGMQFGSSNPTQKMIDNVPSCPVNVPLCRRDPCQPSNPDLEKDAFACTNEPGCCFDMNLWLYKNWFGLYREVPACYRSVKSSVYYDYIGKFATWRPEWGIYIAKTFETYDRNNTDMWGYNQKCPNNKHWSVTVAQSLYQRTTQIMNDQKNNQNTQGNGMFGVAMMNPIGFKTLEIVRKLTSELNESTKQIIDRLSGDCDWMEITRFECQMQGCCWQPENGADPLDNSKGRCIKHFDLNDYTDDEKFVTAISHALSMDYESEESSTTSSSTSSNSDGVVPHFGGNLPIGNMGMAGMGSMGGMGYGNNNAYGNSNPYGGMNSYGQQNQMPFGSLFGRRRKKRSPEPFGFGFGSSNQNTNNYRNQRQSNSPFSGMNGMNNQPQTPYSMFSNSYRNPRDEVLLDSNPFAANNPYQNLLQNMNPNDPTSMLALSMMSAKEGSDSKDILNNMLQNQKMEQMKRYTDTINPQACPAIKPNKKRQCASYSGSLKDDLNTCQARGCCFDVESWYKLDEENKALEEAAENQSATSSDDDDDTPPWMRNGLANGGFGPTNVKLPQPKQKNPFSGMFGRRKRRSPEPQPQSNFQRSMTNVQVNPFLPQAFQVDQVCTWENPFDEKHNLASLKPVIKQCCQQVMCYHAESSATWANWAEWSLCTASCNGGERTRTRMCVDGENMVDESLCRGRPTQVDRCNSTPCPEMQAWSNWSQCSKSCGQGMRTRQRECSHQGQCQGESKVDSEPCKVAHCMSSWSEWGLCDKPCGTGQQTRTRSCIETGAICTAIDEDVRPCNTDFCESWSEWSTSSSNCEVIDRPCGQGKQLLYRSCQGGQVGSPGCPQNAVTQKYVACELDACPIWSTWGVWTECRKTMQYGTIRQRERSCPIEKACGSENPTEATGCFSEWTSWSNCGWSTKTKNRKRYCQSPKFGCKGENRESASCDQNSNLNNQPQQGMMNQNSNMNMNMNSNSGGYGNSGYSPNSPWNSNSYGASTSYSNQGYPVNGGSNSNNGYGYGNNGAMGSYGNSNGNRYGNQMSFYNKKETFDRNPLRSVDNNAWGGIGSNFFGRRR